MRVVLCRNQSGFALVGIMVTVFIVAALVYGGVFFSNNDTNPQMNANDANIHSPVGAIKALDQAKEDIGKVNNELRIKNQEIEELDSKEKMEIEILDIEENKIVLSPLVVRGKTSKMTTFVVVELRNLEHKTLVKEKVVVKKSAEYNGGAFAVTINFEFSSTEKGYLAVYEEGNEDNMFEIKVKFKDINN